MKSVRVSNVNFEDQNKGIQLLDWAYERCLDGIPNVSKTIPELANDYLYRYKDSEVAINKLIKSQISKNTVNGFVTSVGGAVTLPVTIAMVPANITSVIYVQMRMVAAIAYIRGYDLNNYEVQTFIYGCIVGKGISDIFKEAGINTGMKLGNNVIKKIPVEVLKKINKVIGSRFVTKGGKKSVVKLTKLVPVVGGIIGGGFDYSSTKVIAARAKKVFDNSGIINLNHFE